MIPSSSRREPRGHLLSQQIKHEIPFAQIQGVKIGPALSVRPQIHLQKIAPPQKINTFRADFWQDRGKPLSKIAGGKKDVPFKSFFKNVLNHCRGSRHPVGNILHLYCSDDKQHGF